MSDTSVKVKDAVQELDFLNGEIGRVKTVKSSLEKDIEDLEVQKATSYKQFQNDSAARSLELEKIEKVINNKNGLVTSLSSELGSLELVLEDKRKELDLSDAKIKDNIEKGIELSKVLEDRRNVAKTAEEKARIVIKEAEEKQKFNNEREASLDRKEESISGTISSLEKERDDEKKLILVLREKLLANDELRRTLDGKRVNLEILEKEYNTKLAKQKLDNEEFFALQKRAESLEVTLIQKVRDAQFIENELLKQKTILASREADLVLRERECRLKEKTLSLRDREAQLE